MKKEKNHEIDKNIMFIGTIYDSFEALEETLGKMKMEEPLFLTYIAKRAFADAIFKHVKENNKIYLKDDALQNSARNTDSRLQ